MFCWLKDLTSKSSGGIEQQVMRVLNKGFNLNNTQSKVSVLNSIGEQFNNPINLELSDTKCVIKDEYGVQLMSFFKHTGTGSWVMQ